MSDYLAVNGGNGPLLFTDAVFLQRKASHSSESLSRLQSSTALQETHEAEREHEGYSESLEAVQVGQICAKSSLELSIWFCCFFHSFYGDLLYSFCTFLVYI